MKFMYVVMRSGPLGGRHPVKVFHDKYKAYDFCKRMNEIAPFAKRKDYTYSVLTVGCGDEA